MTSVTIRFHTVQDGVSVLAICDDCNLDLSTGDDCQNCHYARLLLERNARRAAEAEDN